MPSNLGFGIQARNSSTAQYSFQKIECSREKCCVVVWLVSLKVYHSSERHLFLFLPKSQRDQWWQLQNLRGKSAKPCQLASWTHRDNTSHTTTERKENTYKFLFHHETAFFIYLRIFFYCWAHNYAGEMGSFQCYLYNVVFFGDSNRILFMCMAETRINMSMVLYKCNAML